MQTTSYSIRRRLATATVACACLASLIGSASASASAAFVPIQSYTIPSPESGCPVPGTGTVRPCILATPDKYIGIKLP